MTKRNSEFVTQVNTTYPTDPNSLYNTEFITEDPGGWYTPEAEDARSKRWLLEVAIWLALVVAMMLVFAGVAAMAYYFFTGFFPGLL